MKMILLFLHFLFSVTSLCWGSDSVEQLQKLYSIENLVLTTQANQKFEHYPYESKLHFELAFRLKDLMLAGQIHQAYKKHLLPIIVQEPGKESYMLCERLSRALIEVCHYFGSPTFTPLTAFQKACEFQGIGEWTSKHESALESFVKEANISLYPLEPKNINAPYTVVIITTTCSGGNHTAALSIAQMLESIPNTKVVLIDFEKVCENSDPVLIATGSYTYDMIYSKILQCTNDLDVNSKRKKLSREIQGFIPNNTIQKLKKDIASINPDLIISTRSYTSDDLSLATLGIPFRLFHPDFELNNSLCSYYRSVPSKNIRFWTPSIEIRMFEPLLDHLKERFSSNEIEGALSNFDLVGYPSKDFFIVSDQTALREKWRVKKSDKVVFVVMGKQGTASMGHVFSELSQIDASTLKFFYICGKNEVLKKDLQKNATPSTQILGLLSPQEMNEIMNISSLGISKAGGATISEAIATNTPLLLYESYPWEEANAAHLIELGLGLKVDPEQPLSVQVNGALSNIKPANNQPIDWREKLLKKLP